MNSGENLFKGPLQGFGAIGVAEIVVKSARENFHKKFGGAIFVTRKAENGSGGGKIIHFFHAGEAVIGKIEFHFRKGFEPAISALLGLLDAHAFDPIGGVGVGEKGGCAQTTRKTKVAGFGALTLLFGDNFDIFV